MPWHLGNEGEAQVHAALEAVVAGARQMHDTVPAAVRATLGLQQPHACRPALLRQCIIQPSVTWRPVNRPIIVCPWYGVPHMSQPCKPIAVRKVPSIFLFSDLMLRAVEGVHKQPCSVYTGLQCSHLSCRFVASRVYSIGMGRYLNAPSRISKSVPCLLPCSFLCQSTYVRQQTKGKSK